MRRAPEPGIVARLTPALAPLVVAAGLALLGRPTHALVPLAIGVVLLALVAVGVDVATPFGRVVGALATAVSAVAGALLFVLLIVPAWLWAKVSRRDPLHRRGRPPAWVRLGPAPAAASATSLSSATPGVAGRRGLVSRITWSIGCVVLLLGLNYGTGWAWDRATASDPAGASTAQEADAPPRDTRADTTAMADYPWREEYFADLTRTGGQYWPFTEFRSTTFRSEYLNIDGWARRSYQAPGDREGRPEVWMFGGSSTFGEGQRDEYTIASHLARLAAADGIPIDITNYGQRGWTLFQEMVLYEQRLALDGPPDLAVFNDGANEFTTQSLMTEAVPSHTMAYAYAKGGPVNIATRIIEPDADDSPLEQVWHDYSEHSSVHKLVRWLRGEPAGAAPADAPIPGFTEGLDANDDGTVDNYDVTEQDGIDAGRVYERSKFLTRALSERYDVPDAYFWQPTLSAGSYPYQQAALDQLSDTTVDQSTVLKGKDVFIDFVHTNEEGARLVAEDMWRTLEPMVRDWYDQR